LCSFGANVGGELGHGEDCLFCDISMPENFASTSSSGFPKAPVVSRDGQEVW